MKRFNINAKDFLTLAILIVTAFTMLPSNADANGNHDRARAWCADYIHQHPGNTCRTVHRGRACADSKRGATFGSVFTGYKTCIPKHVVTIEGPPGFTKIKFNVPVSLIGFETFPSRLKVYCNITRRADESSTFDFELLGESEATVAVNYRNPEIQVPVSVERRSNTSPTFQRGDDWQCVARVFGASIERLSSTTSVKGVFSGR